MKNSSDPIGNRTCGLLAFSTVPQQLHHCVPHLEKLLFVVRVTQRHKYTVVTIYRVFFNVTADGACSYHYTLTFKAGCLNFICCPSISRSQSFKEGFSMLHLSTM